MTPGGDRRPHGQRAGVVEGAVAEVLHEVPVVGERGQPDPLGALAAHLGQAQLVAAAGAVQRDHGVAADTHPDQGVVGGPGRDVVRAAGAEVRGAAGDQRQVDAGPPARARAAPAGRRRRPAAGPGRSGRPAPTATSSVVSAPLAVSSGRPFSSCRPTTTGAPAPGRRARRSAGPAGTGSCPRPPAPAPGRRSARPAAAGSAGNGIPIRISRTPSWASAPSSRPRSSSARSTTA